MSDMPQSDAAVSSGPVSNMSILLNIFTAPQKAFEDIEKRYNFLLPLLSLTLFNAVLIIFLYSNIDYEWFVDYMVQAQAGELTNAEQDQQRQAMEMLSPGTMGAIGAISVAIFLAIMFCIYSAYLVIVSNITNDGFQFKQWFSLVTWSTMPSLVSTLAQYVVILTSSNGQIAPETLNPLSLNELFFGLDAISGVGSILATTDITMFWSIALLSIGYSKWTKKSYANSLIIVLIPYILYYSVRFLLI